MKESTDKAVEEAPSIQTPAPIAQPAQNEPDVSLTIQDLTTALQIIDVVTARGAIRAEEMSVVGSLYNKLKAFLAASADAVKKLEAEKAAAEGETGETGETPGKKPAANKAKK